jgi:pilus assembly protein Flp/PilA
MLDHFKGKIMDEDGQALVEYGLLLALLTAVSVGTLTILGIRLGTAFQTIGNALP